MRCLMTETACYSIISRVKFGRVKFAVEREEDLPRTLHEAQDLSCNNLPSLPRLETHNLNSSLFTI